MFVIIVAREIGSTTYVSKSYCGFCKTLNERNTIAKSYSGHEMLTCSIYSGRYCAAIAVLAKREPITEKEFTKITKKEPLELDNVKYFKCNLLKIKRVIGSNIYPFIHVIKKPLVEKILRKSDRHGYPHSQQTIEYKYGVYNNQHLAKKLANDDSRDYDSDGESRPIKYPIELNSDIFDEYGCEVDSYNLAKPKNKYPEGLDISTYDNFGVALEYEEDGVVKYTRYLF